MKKLVIVFFILQACMSDATTYYIDATNGDDKNQGNAKNNAWKSINKVNGAQFVAGDSILFKRGETFRGNLIAASGLPDLPITYDAYGSGSKPLIIGSLNRTAVKDWVYEGSNIWKLNESLDGKKDIGNVIFNNEATTGVKVWDAEDLKKQGEFFYDRIDDTLRIYSISNPASFYTNIELAIRNNIINCIEAGYVNFSNLDLRYGASHGIRIEDSSFISIINCVFSYIGGGSLFLTPGETTRYGNGIEIWHDCSDISIEKCMIDQIYDAGLTSQGIDNNAYQYFQFNIYFRNNIVRNCEYSYEFFGYEFANIHDIYFENNICINAGGGWGHNQRPDAQRGTNIMVWRLPMSTPNCYIRNNIFSNSTQQSATYWFPERINNIIVNNNCYYEKSGNIARVGNDFYDYATQIETYQFETGHDSNSVFSNSSLKGEFTFDDSWPCIINRLTEGSIKNN